MSLFICPICGKQCSIRFYDPTGFVVDILIIRKRGLGRGMGFEEVERYSLRDGSDPELLDLISDRVAVVYDMLYEDVEDDNEAEADEEEDEVDFESLSEIDKELLLAERDVAEDEEEYENISDLDEEVIE